MAEQLFTRHTISLSRFQAAALYREANRQGVRFSEVLRQAVTYWMINSPPSPEPPPVKARRA